MMRAFVAGLCITLLLLPSIGAADAAVDQERDILVTFDNTGARGGSAGVRAPYRNRKRYAVASTVRRDARAVADEYQLVEVDHWSIRSLSVYCFVFRVSDAARRADVLRALEQDERVESAQAMNLFETSTGERVEYDDTYADLQHGLQALNVLDAHRASIGQGVRIAIVDSHTDRSHEDLRGRISRHRVFSDRRATIDSEHGTAVASVIGARANNARGMVGVAPGATLDVFVSCWRSGQGRFAVCDTFTLLKALDAMLVEPPGILNMSLVGPHDPLLQRILERIADAGVIIVAANPADGVQPQFPASMPQVIAVGRSDRPANASPPGTDTGESLFAPGDRILVAAPNNRYDFRTGSSLSAAHVSGIVALLLDVAPGTSAGRIREVLFASQGHDAATVSVNACRALALVGAQVPCAD